MRGSLVCLRLGRGIRGGILHEDDPALAWAEVALLADELLLAGLGSAESVFALEAVVLPVES